MPGHAAAFVVIERAARDGPSKARRVLVHIGKVTLTGGLLAWVLLNVDEPRQLFETIVRVPFPVILGATAGIVASTVLVGLRWRVILGRSGWRVTAWTAARNALVGSFFNQTLPSTVGGDTIRMTDARTAGLPWRLAITGILADRLIGMGVLFTLCLTLAPFGPFIENAAGVFVWSIGLALAVVGLVVLVAAGFLSNWFQARETRVARVAAEIVLVFVIMRRSLLNARAAFTVSMLSLCVQIYQVTLAYAFAVAVGIDVSLFDFLLVIPLVNMVAALPVSFAGWGVREATMVVFLGQFAVPADMALAVSVLVGFTTLLSGAAGGLIWFTRRSPVVEQSD